MTHPVHPAAHTFKIGGELAINRLGFGAMRITGRGTWGPPAHKAEALQMLKRLPALNVNFVDTANSYGPGFRKSSSAKRSIPTLAC